jgi:predicted Rossmann fold nucleotide-binding protein DprA/Smf involved in DNA uptake
MKHVAIVASRARTDRVTVDRLVASLPTGTIIVSGGAPGPDTWAEEAAQKYGLAVRVLRPDLKDVRSQGQVTRRYDKRNQQIVDLADETFALVAPNAGAARRTRSGGQEGRV